MRGSQISYRDYSQCLPDYLRELAQDAYSRRNEAIGELTSAPAIRDRQAWVRKTFWRLVGGMPERTPLQTKTVGSFERSGYRVEKLVYESRPGVPVPANLYLPSSAKPPYPGVLFQMGHSLNGKAAEPYQKCCQGLARLGYVVLAFDPMGQGERTYYPQPGGTLTRLDSADTEHTLPGRQMLLVGDTATRFQVWDAVRSLDVLAGHPMVDPKRLASTGQSGGATLTMLLMAVDERLAAAAVSCGNTENFACAHFNPPGSTDDAEQDLIGSGAAAFDRWDLLYPMAPKPLLVLASARDYFGTYSPRYLSSGREEFDKLRKVYAVLGAGDRLAWDETPAPHALAYFLRTRIYTWFERWLHDRVVTDVPEPEVAPEKDETLWVGRTGNVIRDFGSKTPLALAREEVHLPDGKPARAAIARLIGTAVVPDAKANVIARVPSEACEIIAIDVATAPRVYAPAWLFAPRKPDPSKAGLLMVEPGGRSRHWGEGGLCHQLASKGLAVCAADLRGIGDAAPEVSRGNMHYALGHADEEAYAWASLILGKPMIGQRVTDLVAMVRALKSLDAMRGRRIVIAASGSMAVPALFAAALEPGIDSLYLAGGLVSFQSLLDVEEYKQTTANFIPGVLNVCDLPSVAALVAPRRVVLAGAVDGAGGTMPVARVQQLYSSASSIEVRPEPAWGADTLAQL